MTAAAIATGGTPPSAKIIRGFRTPFSMAARRFGFGLTALAVQYPGRRRLFQADRLYSASERLRCVFLSGFAGAALATRQDFRYDARKKE